MYVAKTKALISCTDQLRFFSIIDNANVCVKPQLHIHGFGPGRATVHPDLASR